MNDDQNFYSSLDDPLQFYSSNACMFQSTEEFPYDLCLILRFSVPLPLNYFHPQLALESNYCSEIKCVSFELIGEPLAVCILQ